MVKSNIFKDIKIVAFDVGDTLHQFADPRLMAKCFEGEIRVLRKEGLKFTKKDYLVAAEKAWRESLKKKYKNDYFAAPKLVLKYLGFSYNKVLVSKMVNSFTIISNKYLLKTKRTMPGAIDIVKYLHNKGYILGVISDTNNNKPKKWLKEANIYSYFKIIVLSCDVGGRKGTHKPFMAFKDLAYKKFKVKSSEIVMIGNLSVDMDAKKLGYKTILFNPMSLSHKHFIFQPDINIKHLKDIKKYL